VAHVLHRVRLLSGGGRLLLGRGSRDRLRSGLLLLLLRGGRLLLLLLLGGWGGRSLLLGRGGGGPLLVGRGGGGSRLLDCITEDETTVKS